MNAVCLSVSSAWPLFIQIFYKACPNSKLIDLCINDGKPNLIRSKEIGAGDEIDIAN